MAGMVFDENLFEDDCILPFEMEGREKVFVEDAAGRILVVRAPTVDEWHYFNLREQAKIDAEEQEAEYYRNYGTSTHYSHAHEAAAAAGYGHAAPMLAAHDPYYGGGGHGHGGGGGGHGHGHGHGGGGGGGHGHGVPPAPRGHTGHSPKSPRPRLSIEPMAAERRASSSAPRRASAAYMPAHAEAGYGYDPHSEMADYLKAAGIVQAPTHGAGYGGGGGGGYGAEYGAEEEEWEEVLQDPAYGHGYGGHGGHGGGGGHGYPPAHRVSPQGHPSGARHSPVDPADHAPHGRRSSSRQAPPPKYESDASSASGSVKDHVPAKKHPGASKHQHPAVAAASKHKQHSTAHAADEHHGASSGRRKSHSVPERRYQFDD